MKILRQVEIVIIFLPLIVGHSLCYLLVSTKKEWRSCCTLRPQFWYAPELSNSGTYQNCWKEQFWYTASGRIVPTILVCSRIVGAILVRTKSVGRKQCTYFESCLHYIICPINKYKIDIGTVDRYVSWLSGNIIFITIQPREVFIWIV